MAWYNDPAKLTYVASYRSAKDASREANKAAQYGWTPQSTAGTKSTWFKTDQVTMTYVRTPEWQARASAAAAAVPTPEAKASSGRTLPGCAVLVVIGFIVIIIGAVANGSKGSSSTAPTSATAVVAAAAPASPTAAPTIAPSPTVPAGPTASPTPETSYVAFTGGDGVALRKEPGGSEKIKAWPDNTKMIYGGERQKVGDLFWKKVKDPDGNIGWVADKYLAQEQAANDAVDQKRTDEFATYLKENFGTPGYQTSWYPHISSATVTSKSVVIATDLSNTQGSRGVASNLCSAASFYAFEAGRGRPSYISIKAADGKAIIERNGLGDTCK